MIPIVEKSESTENRVCRELELRVSISICLAFVRRRRTDVIELGIKSLPRLERYHSAHLARAPQNCMVWSETLRNVRI
jgi:hypothetical protein